MFVGHDDFTARCLFKNGSRSHTCTKGSRANSVLTPGAPARDNEITALPLFHTIVAAVAVHTAVCGQREVGWPDTSGGGAKGVALTALAEVTLLASTTCTNKQVTARDS